MSLLNMAAATLAIVLLVLPVHIGAQDMGSMTDHSGHNMTDHSGHNMTDHSGHNMTGHTGHNMTGHSGHNMTDHYGHNMTGHTGHNMTGHTGHNMTGHTGHNMTGHGTNHTGHGTDHTGHGTDHTGHGTDHTGHGMEHAGHDMMNMDHEMKMYFHTGVEEYVLFEDCKTESEGAIIGACFAIFAVAVLYEGLKFIREYLLQRSLAGRGSVYVESKLPSGSSQEQMVMQMQNTSLASRMLSCSHFVQTVLHMLQVFVSYCLMLVFMTYNVWLCIAVVVGAGFGYFIFGWRRAVVVDSNEHCH